MSEIDLQDYQEAYRQVIKEEETQAFYYHLVVYILVNLILVFVNLYITGSEFLWFVFPLVGWGIGIVNHYLYIRNVEEKIKKKQAQAEKITRNGDIEE